VVKAFQSRYTSPESWLYKQYRQYAIRIQDFDDQIKQYNIPLIDTTVTLGQSLNNSAFAESNPGILSQLLPQRTSSFRLVLFPQTRYSFIEDKVKNPSVIQWHVHANYTDVSWTVPFTGGAGEADGSHSSVLSRK
jgi:hypothetical protein